MTAEERAINFIASVTEPRSAEEAVDTSKRLAAAIEEAENAAVAAALADVVRLLKHCGKRDAAARLVFALQADREAVRKGQATAFPALRAAVPLPV